MGSLTSSAYVVFSKQTDLLWLHALKDGYRHCFVLLNDGKGWLSLDPMLHHMELKAHRHLDVDFDLPAWLENTGLIVVPASLDYSKKCPAPLSFLSCVSVAKRVLGIHNRFIITPYQLYKHLTRDRIK